MVGQRALLAAVAVLGACIGPDTPSCDGLVCPTDKICDPHRVTCVLPSQVTACASMPDATACVFPGETDGVCDHGVCFTSECGDGLVSADEVCDDANSVDGDGCSAFCLSDERCGNGIVDVAIGESCDDHDLRSGDGCSSACTAEVASWHELSLDDYPGEYGAVAVYDSARERIVQFGGTSPTGQPVDELEELHAGQWERVSRTTQPDPRSGHAMSYDARRRATVVFGGHGANGPLGDAWTYDGDWHPLMTQGQPGPGPREGVASAYDAARGQVVVFGGSTGNAVFDETWVLAGGTWTRKLVPGPPGRRDHLMAYDPVRQVVVMFGGTAVPAGSPVQADELSDTWEWDGVAWSQVTTATETPLARAAMVWDGERSEMMLIGGRNQSSSDTHHLVGGHWSQLVNVPYTLRRLPAAAYDPIARVLILHGGTKLAPGISGPPLNDTWSYASNTWSRDTDADPHAPPARGSAGFAFDRAHSRAVLAAGFMPGNDVNFPDTWEYDGRQWVQIADTPDWRTCPVQNCPTAMVELPGTGTFLLVRAVGSLPVETWKFDGATWKKLTLASAPPSRDRFAMTYDTTRKVLVFAGGMAGPTAIDDVWELSNNAWVNRTSSLAMRPSARAGAGLTYDTVRKATVLFGGVDAQNHSLGDTWLYDGTAWTQQQTAVAPVGRSGMGLAFHEARGRTILFGGDAMNGPQSDTWELDATGWTQLTVFEGPQPRSSPRLVYDANRKLIILHGGDPQNDTWELVFRSTLADENCAMTGDEDGDGLANCADPDCSDAPCSDDHLCDSASGMCACANTTELRCGDGTDDDCDGKIDCADSDCATDAACMACATSPSCEAHEMTCNDNIDNDGDGLADCRDPDCYLDPCQLVIP
ncbi:MAG TPA: DUF4215 domain-containing protein [Kofleriaceae bacterium]|jgi:cysteine-rich repeat protein